jgi:hypothetical protein
MLWLIRQRLSNDSSRIVEYPVWWHRYFSRIAPKGIKELSLVAGSVTFLPASFTKSPNDSLIFAVKVSDK